jgi:hypothetical protein
MILNSFSIPYQENKILMILALPKQVLHGSKSKEMHLPHKKAHTVYSKTSPDSMYICFRQY